MTTKQELLAQLEAMNLPHHSVVLMHTSLRAVGETEGRGEGLLQTLIDYCRSIDTLFCVPTHTWSLHGEKGVITLDLLGHETCLGTFPKLATYHPDGVRTLNPTHSMVVFGEKSKREEFAALDEQFCRQTPTPWEGCYGEIARRGGVTLLVGVGLNKYTYMHEVEEKLGVPNRNPEAVEATVRLKDGRILNHPISTIAGVGIGDVSQYFPKYEPAFRKFGVIRDGKLGEANVMICDAVKTEEVMALIRKNSHGAELLSNHDPLPAEFY